MRRWWPFLVLGLALVGSLAWGYTQNRERARLALRAENSYQQAFHRLEDGVVNIEDRLARLLATTTPALQRDFLQDLRVFSNVTQESLAGLPLINVPLERTHNFLGTLSEAMELYSDQIDTGTALSETQWADLKEMYMQARTLKDEVAALAPEVAHGRIRWFQTERVTQLTADGTGTTAFLSAVSRIDGNLQPPGEEEATRPGAGTPLPRPKGDLGPSIQGAEAIRRAAQFMDLPPAVTPTLGNQIDGNFPIFVVHAVKSNQVPVSIGVTQQGGHVVWMLDGRPIGPATLDRQQVVERGQQFLAENDLPGMKALFYDEYEEAGPLAVVTYVQERDGITYFNERVKVRMARDDGEIVGYDATEYWVNRRDRPALKPALSPEEAAARLNPTLAVKDVSLGVVDVFRGREALVYKVRAELDGSEFDVYINAVTGDEERVERVEKEVRGEG